MPDSIFANLTRQYNHAIQLFIRGLTPYRVKTYPPIFAVMMFVGWIISQLRIPGLIDSARTIIGIDFVAFFTAGSFFLQGRFAELYDPAAQLKFQQDLVAPAITDKFMFFVSPPFTVPLYIPFALGEYLTGLFLWWGVGLFALLFSLHLLRKELFQESPPSLLRLFLLSFTFYPTLFWFIDGQSTSFTLLVYIAFFVLLRRNKDFSAGLLLGLLIYKPTLALGLGAALLFKFRWRALLGCVISAGTWSLSGFVFFPAIMKIYITQSFDLLRAAIADPWGALSLHEFSLNLLGQIWKPGSTILSAVLTVGAVIMIFMFWQRTPWQPGSRAWDMTWAATIAIGLIIGQHLGVYDVMLLLPGFMILWSYYPRGTNGRLLDNGQLFAWSAIVYILGFLSIISISYK